MISDETDTAWTQFSSTFSKYEPFVSPKLRVKYDPQYGRSLVACQSIKPGEVLIRVSPQGLLNLKTLSNPTDHSAQGQLARVLAEAKSESNHEWHAFTQVLPKAFSSVPLTWEIIGTSRADQQRGLNDPSCRKHISKQKSVFLQDFSTCGSGIPIEEYLWAWLCVNSRCLYISITSEASNNITLAPIIDFLNHTGDGSRASKMEYSSTKGMAIVAGPSYEPGEEIFITYGAHSNLFLLCEYGFVLSDNQHDFIDISSDIPLTEVQLSALESLGYKDEYTVSAQAGPSFRTTVALVAATISDDWTTTPRQLKLLTEGYIDETRFQAQTTKLLQQILERKVEEWSSAESTSDLGILYKGWISIAQTVLNNSRG